MPLYEFDCPDCTQPFEKLVRSASKIDEVTCPNCGSAKVTRRMSTFAVRGGGTSTGTSAASCSTGGT